MNRRILLTGAPGVGKTTVIRRVADALGVDASGFYTEEKRENGRRVGFEIVTLDGRRAPLSHVHIPGKPRVGRYGVDVDSLDTVAVPALLEAVGKRRIAVIDEIGKMELFSKNFREAVLTVFDSPASIVAVIMSKRDPFADSLKARSDVELIMVTPARREKLPAQIVERLRSRSGR